MKHFVKFPLFCAASSSSDNNNNNNNNNNQIRFFKKRKGNFLLLYFLVILALNLIKLSDASNSKEIEFSSESALHNSRESQENPALTQLINNTEDDNDINEQLIDNSDEIYSNTQQQKTNSNDDLLSNKKRYLNNHQLKLLEQFQQQTTKTPQLPINDYQQAQLTEFSDFDFENDEELHLIFKSILSEHSQNKTTPTTGGLVDYSMLMSLFASPMTGKTPPTSLPKTDPLFISSRRLFNEICVYITVIIILTGLIGNILSLKVFCSTKLPRTSSRSYLIALTVSDAVFLITHFIDNTCKEIVDLWQLDFPINLTDQKQTMCRSFALLRNVCRAASPWIIVAFTLERFLVVIFPQHLNIISKPLLAKRLIAVILLLSLLISLYVPIFSGLVTSPNFKKLPKKFRSQQYALTMIATSAPLFANYYKQNFYKKSCDVLADYREVYLYFTLVYTIIVILIPLVVVSLFNTILIVRLYKSNDQWTSAKLELHEQELSYKEIRDKKVQIENLKITWTLIIISASFIFLTLPHVVLYFVVNIKYLKNSVQSRSLYQVQKITELLYIFNHSINFFLYVVTRQSFRKVLKEKLKCDCLNLKSHSLHFHLVANKQAASDAVINDTSTNNNVNNNSNNNNNNKSTDSTAPASNQQGKMIRNENANALLNSLNDFNIHLLTKNAKYNVTIQPEAYENYWDTFTKEGDETAEDCDKNKMGKKKKKRSSIKETLLQMRMIKKK